MQALQGRTPGGLQQESGGIARSKRVGTNLGRSRYNTMRFLSCRSIKEIACK